MDTRPSSDASPWSAAGAATSTPYSYPVELPPAPPSGMPPAGPPPASAPRRRRGLLAVAVAAIALGVIGAAAAGFAAGRGTAPIAAPVTTTVTDEPQQQGAFTKADGAWCREYMATIDRLIEAGKAAGAPRAMAAPDLPATAWSSEDAAANQAMAEQSNRWNSALTSLRASTANPTLKMLIDASYSTDTELAAKILDKTYKPADYDLFRATNATDNALGAICDRI
ncbi:hypothetical protein [Mycolicibacterium fortuitum]